MSSQWSSSPDEELVRELDQRLAREEAYYSYEFYFGPETDSPEAWRKWKLFAHLRARLKAGEDVIQEAREALKGA